MANNHRDLTSAAHRIEDVPSIVKQNIEKLHEHRMELRRQMGPWERMAHKISDYCGTTQFVLFNAIFFAVWIIVNTRIGGMPAFDPYPFGMLTMVVSLEAIFLSLFVLLTQNRMQQAADRESELDLQVNLLTEHELTRVLIAVDRIAQKLGVDLPVDSDQTELETETRAEAVMESIEEEAENGPS